MKRNTRPESTTRLAAAVADELLRAELRLRRRERFDLLGRLFRYPGEDYAETANRLAERLAHEGSRAAESMFAFATYADSVPLYELEESFTRTFDLNPSCAAEIGWHLFGEEYVRGLFMVRMREEMRQRGLEETGELPDHVVHVLAVLGAMEEGPARELARACVCPAVGKMRASLEGGGKDRGKGEGEIGQSDDQSSHSRFQSPFGPLVEALAQLLLEEFNLPADAFIAREEENAAPEGVDLLHSSPCGTGGCGPSGCGPSPMIQLNTEH